MDLDAALEQQERLAELVDARRLVVKTAAIEGWSPAALGRAQSLHSGLIIASMGSLSMSRAAPMSPP